MYACTAPSHVPHKGLQKAAGCQMKRTEDAFRSRIKPNLLENNQENVRCEFSFSRGSMPSAEMSRSLVGAYVQEIQSDLEETPNFPVNASWDDVKYVPQLKGSSNVQIVGHAQGTHSHTFRDAVVCLLRVKTCRIHTIPFSLSRGLSNHIKTALRSTTICDKIATKFHKSNQKIGEKITQIT